MSCRPQRRRCVLMSGTYIIPLPSRTDWAASLSPSSKRSSRRGIASIARRLRTGRRAPPASRAPPAQPPLAEDGGSLGEDPGAGISEVQSAIDTIFIPKPPRRSPIHTVCECLTFPIRSVIKSFQGIVRYFRRMCAAFGVRFVVLCFVASGSVGTAESIATFAGKYLYTDAPPNGLGLTAARVEVMEVFVFAPPTHFSHMSHPTFSHISHFFCFSGSSPFALGDEMSVWGDQ